MMIRVKSSRGRERNSAIFLSKITLIHVTVIKGIRQVTAGMTSHHPITSKKDPRTIKMDVFSPNQTYMTRTITFMTISMLKILLDRIIFILNKGHLRIELDLLRNRINSQGN